MSSAQFFILLSVIYSSRAITSGWAIALGGVCLALALLALLAFWCEWSER